ncbi:MAG: lipopolysaccharide kinase InaA family protein [Opitutales bacterium]
MKQAISRRVLRKATLSLKTDWSFVRQCGIDPPQVDVRSQVTRVEFVDHGRPVPAYLKLYTYRKHPFQRIFRLGRSYYECRNLLFFKSLGIPAARALAWGKHRNPIGRITEEFIVTEALEGAIPLHQYVREQRPGALDAARIARRIGRWLRDLHAHGFYHKDLHWRNILVRKSDGRIELGLIDCPRGDFHRLGPIRRHWRLKDCATLDKYAHALFPLSARAVFLRHYLGAGRGSPAFERWSRRIPDYRRLRFDQRKGRSKVRPLDPDAPLPD